MASILDRQFDKFREINVMRRIHVDFIDKKRNPIIYYYWAKNKMSDYITTLAAIQPHYLNKSLLTSQSEEPNSSISTIISVKELEREPGAIALLSDFRDSTDPKYVGPGTWNVIHRYSFQARNYDQQQTFLSLMKEICSGFPCTICRGHCTEYIKNHPLEEYLNVNVDINGEQIPLGLFVWTWKFHNAVNARLKKPSMSWDTAYNLYSDTGSLVCGKSCLESDDIPPDGTEHDNSVPSLPEPQARGFPVIVDNSTSSRRSPLELAGGSNSHLPVSQPLPFKLVFIRR